MTNEIIGGRIWDYDHLIPFRDSSAGCVLSKHCGVNGGFMKVVIMEYSGMILSLATLLGVLRILQTFVLGEAGIWARLIFVVIGGA